MRNLTPLEALFSLTRRKLLAAVFVRPGKWWYLSELAQHLRTTPSSLQRELSALVAGGILEKRREGTRAYFRADTRSPLFPELVRLFEKTAGLVPVLRHTLELFGNRIVCAFVYGSVARREEHAQSDVDLLVIGKIGLAELSPALRKVERKLGREVNVTTYSVADFQARIRRHDHFLSNVMRGPKEFLKGDGHELERIAGPQGRPAAQNIKA